MLSIYIVIVKRPRMTLYTLRLNLRVIKQTLLRLWEINFASYRLFIVLFQYPLIFLFVVSFFFTTEVAMSGRWDFYIEMLLSTCVVLLWLDCFNSNTHTFFHVNVWFIQLPLTSRYYCAAEIPLLDNEFNSCYLYSNRNLNDL